MNYIAALSLGFLGSFHCIGMCGSIALALPLNNRSAYSKITGSLLYNFGRATTYACFGVLFGALGKGFVIGGYQQLLSIVLGSLVLLYVLLPTRVFTKFKITAPLYKLNTRLKTSFTYLFHQKTLRALFFIGTLNGLLPCGLVYMGIAGAIATGSMLQGALFMLFFGLGTLPAMLALSMSGTLISLSFRNRIRKTVPVFVSIMGVLLILRGLNLGIPYISPEMSKTQCEAHSCCHKK